MGEGTGEETGEEAGEKAGEGTGEEAGEKAGEKAGEETGEEAGEGPLLPHLRLTLVREGDNLWVPGHQICRVYQTVNDVSVLLLFRDENPHSAFQTTDESIAQSTEFSQTTTNINPLKRDQLKCTLRILTR